jgi:hypothetical protein
LQLELHDVHVFAPEVGKLPIELAETVTHFEHAVVVVQELHKAPHAVHVFAPDVG